MVLIKNHSSCLCKNLQPWGTLAVHVVEVPSSDSASWQGWGSGKWLRVRHGCCIFKDGKKLWNTPTNHCVFSTLKCLVWQVRKASVHLHPIVGTEQVTLVPAAICINLCSMSWHGKHLTVLDANLAGPVERQSMFQFQEFHVAAILPKLLDSRIDRIDPLCDLTMGFFHNDKSWLCHEINISYYFIMLFHYILYPMNIPTIPNESSARMSHSTARFDG